MNSQPCTLVEGPVVECDRENPQERLLPSGRSVVLKVDESGEELLVRSPQGEVEVRIVLTEAGPVVKLKGARLELEAVEALSVRCAHFEVDASKGAHIRTNGPAQIDAQEMRVRTDSDIHMNGKVIRLNC